MITISVRPLNVSIKIQFYLVLLRRFTSIAQLNFHFNLKEHFSQDFFARYTGTSSSPSLLPFLLGLQVYCGLKHDFFICQIITDIPD